jgi:hypothetical protein
MDRSVSDVIGILIFDLRTPYFLEFLKKCYHSCSMQLMVAGDKWELYIPSELGYGDGGSPPKIGGGDVLIFQMEILGILGDSVPAIACKLDKTGCNEKEVKYIKKIAGFEKSKVKSEIERINKLMPKPMSDITRDWAKRRRHLLMQLEDTSTNTEL